MTPLWWLLGAMAVVSGGVFVAGRAARRQLRRSRDDHSLRPELWERFYSVDWGQTCTNNYGYAPASGDHPQRFQRQMYRELFNRLKATGSLRSRMKLLEVSCGRGGGLDAFLSEGAECFEAIGLDVAPSAIDYCNRTYSRDGLTFLVGSALDLPFEANQFDVLLNVEASNDYGDRARFFREVARVLKPGGIFLYADSFRSGHVAMVQKQLTDAGLTVEFRDITQNVLQACRHDTPRRREVLRRHAPLASRIVLGRQLSNYAGLEGSSKYRSFAEGRRTYLMAAAIAE
nr:Methyltransferase domain protein [uncultured bacterium]